MSRSNLMYKQLPKLPRTTSFESYVNARFPPFADGQPNPMSRHLLQINSKNEQMAAVFLRSLSADSNRHQAFQELVRCVFGEGVPAEKFIRRDKFIKESVAYSDVREVLGFGRAIHKSFFPSPRKQTLMMSMIRSALSTHMLLPTQLFQSVGVAALVMNHFLSDRFRLKLALDGNNAEKFLLNVQSIKVLIRRNNALIIAEKNVLQPSADSAYPRYVLYVLLKGFVIEIQLEPAAMENVKGATRLTTAQKQAISRFFDRVNQIFLFFSLYFHTAKVKQILRSKKPIKGHDLYVVFREVLAVLSVIGYSQNQVICPKLQEDAQYFSDVLRFNMNSQCRRINSNFFLKSSQADAGEGAGLIELRSYLLLHRSLFLSDNQSAQTFHSPALSVIKNWFLQHTNFQVLLLPSSPFFVEPPLWRQLLGVVQQQEIFSSKIWPSSLQDVRLTGLMTLLFLRTMDPYSKKYCLWYRHPTSQPVWGNDSFSDLCHQLAKISVLSEQKTATATLTLDQASNTADSAKNAMPS